jgi:hypothetical protein
LRFGIRLLGETVGWVVCGFVAGHGDCWSLKGLLGGLQGHELGVMAGSGGPDRFGSGVERAEDDQPLEVGHGGGEEGL